VTDSESADDRHASLQARRTARRDELLAAAVDVIRSGGADATMEELASAGGISKPILYRHFSDRGGLIAAIIDHALAELGQILDHNLAHSHVGESQTRATIDAFFEYIEREPELYRFVMDHDSREGGPATHAFTEQMASHVGAAIGRGLVAAGRDPAPAEVWGRAIVGMVQSTGDWWVAGAPITRAAAVDRLVNLAWSGLRGPPVITEQRRAPAEAPDSTRSTESVP